MAKIIGVKENTVQIGTESGKIVEVNNSALNFIPKIGDEIEVFKGNGKVIISKKETINLSLDELQGISQKNQTQTKNILKSTARNTKNGSNKKKPKNTKMIIACIFIGIFIGIVSANSARSEEDENIMVDHNVEKTSNDEIYQYTQKEQEPSYNDINFTGTVKQDENLKRETGVEVQNKNGVIDDFKYRIDGNLIYLIEYEGKDDCVELETSYVVDGIQYKTDISNFSAYGEYTKLIIHEGFQEVNTPIFNSSDVREVFFPRSMTNVFDYTLAYMHDYDDGKNKIYYAGTKEEWLNIFTKYQRTKVEDAEFGEELGTALADKLNEMMGSGYDSSEFEFFFSASPNDLK